MNKLLVLSCACVVFFNFLYPMKSILKKSDGTEKNKQVKKVSFKDPLIKYYGDGWLLKLTLKLYNGCSTGDILNEGFKEALVKKALKYSCKIEDTLQFLLDYPISRKNLVVLGFPEFIANVSRTFFDEMYLLTKHCLIAPQDPNDLKKEGVSKKMVQKVSELVKHVKTIQATSQTDGHPLVALIIAEKLGYVQESEKAVDPNGQISVYYTAQSWTTKKKTEPSCFCFFPKLFKKGVNLFWVTCGFKNHTT